MIRRSLFAGVVAMVAIVPTSAFAANELDAFRTLSGSEVSFSLGGAYSNSMLTISGPDGFIIRTFSKTGNPAVDLIKAKANVDGVYTYEITAASSETVTIRNPQNNGRGGADRGTMKRGVSATGSFVVKGGMIVDTSQDKEPETQ